MPAPHSGTGGGLSTAIPRQFRRLVTAASSASGVPLKVVAAQIDLESSWNPGVTSPTGAQGIAQFEPGTWQAWGHGSPDNPADAFPAYGRFMGSLLRQYRGNLRDALAAYNAGPGNVQAGYGYADEILSAAGMPQSQAVPYKNPLRGVLSLLPERIDAGVDYGGTGPIYALGPGVITSTRNTGWPGAQHAFIAEKLTAGPLAGHYVYAAENIIPAVRKGQHVTADTKIGDMTGGGIETGFAAAPGTGNPLGKFDGTDPTAAGEAYSKILAKLGAPAGLQNAGAQPTGSLPGWLSAIVRDIKNFDTGVLGAAGAGAGSISGAIGSVGGALGSIAQSVTDFETAISWFFNPANWVRIFCGIAGSGFVIIGLVLMSRTGRAYTVAVPGAGPVPAPGGELAPAMGVLWITIGAVLLFFAFHNIEALGITDLASLLGYITQRVHGGGPQALASPAGGQG